MINIKRELKKIGIKPLEEITVEEKTSIAEKIGKLINRTGKMVIQPFIMTENP